MNRMEIVLHKALSIAERPEEGFYELAGHLAQLQQHDPHRWRQFLERSGMDRRKAYYLAEIAQQFAGLEFPNQRLEAIGWTKLQIIAGSINRRNAKRLLRLAETKTVAQLQALLQGAEPEQRLRCVMMYFTADEYREVEDALVWNGAVRRGRGLRGKEQAMLNLIRQARQRRPGLWVGVGDGPVEFRCMSSSLHSRIQTDLLQLGWTSEHRQSLV